MQLNELSQDLHFDLPALLPWKREFGAGETPGQHLVGGQEPGLLVLGTVFATNPHHLGGGGDKSFSCKHPFRRLSMQQRRNVSETNFCLKKMKTMKTFKREINLSIERSAKRKLKGNPWRPAGRERVPAAGKGGRGSRTSGCSPTKPYSCARAPPRTPTPPMNPYSCARAPPWTPTPPLPGGDGKITERLSRKRIWLVHPELNPSFNLKILFVKCLKEICSCSREIQILSKKKFKICLYHLQSTLFPRSLIF